MLANQDRMALGTTVLAEISKSRPGSYAADNQVHYAVIKILKTKLKWSKRI